MWHSSLPWWEFILRGLIIYVFLLIILPFWSNALVRTFSWTMVLREPLNLLFTYPAIVIGLVHAYLPYAILTCYI